MTARTATATIYNKEVLNDDSVANWLFSTMSVGNMIDQNVAVQDRILLERVPSGDRHLQLIIKAMRESRKIAVTYRRYGAASANSFSVEPYCVKLFKRRWYVLTKLQRKKYETGETYSTMAIFSLDRIEEVVLQQEKFVIDKDFDAAAYFNECFGIVVGDGSKPERIVLRAFGLEQHYMRDLPLHHSQRVIKETEGHTDFELCLRPTSDFIAHLLSRGQWLRVLQPQWMADEIQKWLQEALTGYQKEKIEENLKKE